MLLSSSTPADHRPAAERNPPPTIISVAPEGNSAPDDSLTDDASASADSEALTETIHSLHATDWVALSGTPRLMQSPVHFSVTEGDRGLHFVTQKLPEDDRHFSKLPQTFYWITNKYALFGDFKVALKMIVPARGNGGRIMSIGVRDVEGDWEVSFDPPSRAEFETEHIVELVRQGDTIHLMHDDRMATGKVHHKDSKPQTSDELKGACHFFIKVRQEDEFWITQNDLTRPTEHVKGVQRYQDFLPADTLLPSDIAPRPARADEQIVTLPGEIEDICLGANGKMLIAYVPTEKKLFLVDVATRKQVGEIPVGDQNVRFAAGLEKLVVAPNPHTLQRWDLTSITQEAEVTLEDGVQINDLAMGAAASGPLLVVTEQAGQEPQPALLDVATMQWQQIPIVVDEKQRNKSELPWGRKPQIRAAANGQVFALTCPQETFQLVVQPEQAKLKRFNYTTANRIERSIPDAFGRRTFSSGPNNFVPDFNGRSPGIRLPAVQGNFCLKAGLQLSDQTAPLDLCPASVELFVDGDNQPFATLVDLDLTLTNQTKFNLWNEKRLTEDKRIHWIPDMNTIVTLPHLAGRIVLRDFDLEKAWQEANYDYLYVTNPTPIRTELGSKLKHQLDIRSKNEPVSVRNGKNVTSRAMTVSKSGLLEWDIPKWLFGSPDQTYHKVVLSAGGREVETILVIRFVEPSKQQPTESLAALPKLTPTSSAPAEARSTQSAPRTWTDRESGRQIEARLIDVTGETVRIVRADGQTFDLPLARLTNEDQAYARGWSKTKETKE